jgi:hypothetical protein
MKKMLILTGPQGAGNHLWSKIFSLHPDVFGWKTLLDTYWESHRFNEPFCKYWKNPSKLKDFDWSTHNYFFTSISIPLGIANKGTKWCPNVPEFVKEVEKLAIKTKVLVIGRDKNILKNQQIRLREESTIGHFLDQLSKIKTPTYLSYELLYLYKQEYLKSLDVGIPIAWYDNRINDILKEDANLKYIKYVEYNPLDNCNKTAVSIKQRP